MKRVIIISSLLLSTIAFFIFFDSCARNPVTGKQEFMLLSETGEIKMGQEADKQVVQMYGVYNDKKLAEYIDNMGQKMAKISHRPHLKYEFKVMDSPVINAFAIPGGFVYVTRGILSYLNSEAELAGVVGHEIGHVTARHSAQKYSEASIAQIGLNVGSIISEDFAAFAGLASQGIALLFLKFSRDDERQSDDLGVDYSTKVGYDAREMANFFATLDKMRGKDEKGGLPDWFSTHPNPADRVVSVRNEAKKRQSGLGNKKLMINRDAYLKAINGLIHGENPRHGFAENNVFYHPDMKFQFPIPKNWKVNNLPSQVQMVSSDEKAFILFTLAATSSANTAADKFINQSKVKVELRKDIKVNGLNAVKINSQITDQSGSLRIVSYFIEKSGSVFVFHGFTKSTLFSSYQSNFIATMDGFKTLKDKTKLNVQPDRLRIKKTTKKGTLKQLLTGFGMHEKDLQELALINGYGFKRSDKGEYTDKDC